MWYWYFSGIKFAKQQTSKCLPIQVFSYQTPLLRKLQGLDMQLQHNKVKNLSIAIKQLNKIVLQPGEILSYWKVLGNPTKKKGYLDGMILKNGKVESGTGGGLCQLSNIIFWTALHTPLTVTERWRHGYDVFPDANRTQPFGSGATCAYPNIDLQIKNTSNQSFQLKLELSESDLVASWNTTKPLDTEYRVIERDHEMKNEWWGAYTRHNKIIKQTLDKASNQVQKEEVAVENHAIMMYEPLIEKTTN